MLGTKRIIDLKKVRSEIIALKAELTPEQIESLEIEYFDGNSRYNCIYGLITGDSIGKAADELKAKCAKTSGMRVYVHMTELEEFIVDMVNTDSQIKMIFKFLRSEIKRLRTLKL